MKPKQLITLVIACAVVAGIAIWKRAGRAGDEPDSPDAENPALFADFNPEEVAGFTVKTAKGEATVTREGDKWVVVNRDKFPASMTMVAGMLNNTGAFHVANYEDFDDEAIAANKLRTPGEGVKEEESGTLITMTKPGGGELISFVAGSSITAKGADQGMPPKAQWMQVKGGNKVAKVVDGFSDLKADPREWLDKSGDGKFFKVEKLKSIAVTGPSPEESWSISREKDAGELKLDSPAAGEEFDPAKASAQGNAFAYPNFDDVLPEADKAKAALDKPTHTAVLETFEGLRYTVKVGAKVEPSKQDPPKEGETPPAAPPDAYYVSFSVEGKLDETLPPYTSPAPVAPTAPAAPAADAKEEDKKKFEEAKKKYDEDLKNHETAKKTWEDGKKAFDENEKKNLEKKKERIAAEQALQSRVFVVQKYTLEPVMKKRSDFMKDKPAATPATPATPGAATTPAAPGTAPAASPAPGRIEATTPPIEVKIPGAETPPAPGTPGDAAKKEETKKPETKTSDKKKKPK